MLARVMEIWGSAFFPLVTLICFWLLSRSIRRLREDLDIMHINTKSLYKLVGDLEKEIEDRWRWSQPQPEVRTKKKKAK